MRRWKGAQSIVGVLEGGDETSSSLLFFLPSLQFLSQFFVASENRRNEGIDGGG